MGKTRGNPSSTPPLLSPAKLEQNALSVLDGNPTRQPSSLEMGGGGPKETYVSRTASGGVLAPAPVPSKEGGGDQAVPGRGAIPPQTDYPSPSSAKGHGPPRDPRLSQNGDSGMPIPKRLSEDGGAEGERTTGGGVTANLARHRHHDGGGGSGRGPVLGKSRQISLPTKGAQTARGGDPGEGEDNDRVRISAPRASWGIGNSSSGRQ